MTLVGRSSFVPSSDDVRDANGRAATNERIVTREGVNGETIITQAYCETCDAMVLPFEGSGCCGWCHGRTAASPPAPPILQPGRDTDGRFTPGHGLTPKAGRPPENKWPAVRIIVAIKYWASQHNGLPPTATEWKLKHPDRPSVDDVRKAFGTWNAGILEAGFEPRVGRGGYAKLWTAA